MPLSRRIEDVPSRQEVPIAEHIYDIPVSSTKVKELPGVLPVGALVTVPDTIEVPLHHTSLPPMKCLALLAQIL